MSRGALGVTSLDTGHCASLGQPHSEMTEREDDGENGEGTRRAEREEREERDHGIVLR